MMKRIVGSSCAAAVLAMGVAASAQTTSQSPSQSPVRSSQAPPTQTGSITRLQTDQQVTLTGCLVQETGSQLVLTTSPLPGPAGSTPGITPGITTPSAGAVGTSGTSATPGAPSPGTGAGAGAVGTPGAPGAAATDAARDSAAAVATRYNLRGESDLVQFVGQRVEVIGRIDGAAASSSSTTPAAGAAVPGAPGVTKAPESPTSDLDRAGISGNPPAATAPAGSSATGPAVTPGTGTTSPSVAPPSSVASAAAAVPAQRVNVTSVRAIGGTCQ